MKPPSGGNSSRLRMVSVIVPPAQFVIFRLVATLFIAAAFEKCRM